MIFCLFVVFPCINTFFISFNSFFFNQSFYLCETHIISHIADFFFNSIFKLTFSIDILLYITLYHLFLYIYMKEEAENRKDLYLFRENKNCYFAV